MATVYPKIEVQHTTGLETILQDIYPILGCNHYKKELTDFAEDKTVSVFGAGTTGTYDFIHNYSLDSICGFRGISPAMGSNIEITAELKEVFNRDAYLKEKQNNYAKVRLSPQHSPFGPFRLYLSFKIIGYAFTTGATVNMIVKNGVKKAYSINKPITIASPTQEGVWYRAGFEADMTHFVDMSTGFTDADFNNITDVGIFVQFSGGGGGEVAVKDVLWADRASDDFEGLCPSVRNTYSNSNALFVSQNYGKDTNAGTKEAPLKTIKKALTLNTNLLKHIVLKENDYYDCTNYNGEIQLENTSGYECVITSYLLDEPKIKNKAGLLNEKRVGARKYYRTNWFEIDGVTGWKVYVAAYGNDATGVRGDITKPFKTINGAYAAALTGDCIEFLDSFTYKEIVVEAGTKNITFQAAAKQTPVWEHSGGTCFFANFSSKLRFYNIIFKGSGVGAADKLLDLLSVGDMAVKDCTFTNTSGHCIDCTNVVIENCLFIGNSDYYRGLYNGVGGGTVEISNCKYIGKTTTNFGTSLVMNLLELKM